MRLTSCLRIAVALRCGAGCADATAPDTSHGPAVGTYTLRAVGSDPLPFLLSSSNHSATYLVSETLTLRVDSTFTRAGIENTTVDNVYIPGGGQESTSEDGAWSRQGSRVTLRYTNGSDYGHVESAALASDGTLARTQSTGAAGAPLAWSYAR